MIIYSKFRDYYDGVMYQGTDSSIVYRRFQEDAGTIKYPRVRDSWLAQSLDDKGKGQNRELKSNGKLVMFYDTRVATIFCGKVYMRYIGVIASGKPDFGVVYPDDKRHMYLAQPHRFYANSQEELLAKIAVKYGPFNEKARCFNPNPSSYLNTLPTLIDELNKIDWDQEHLALRSPILSLRSLTREESASFHDRNWEHAMIVKNPCLQEQGFYQIMDAFTTYQNLSMYLGGVMGGEARPMVTLPDIDKLVKAGFDKKTSFRKPKQNIGQ